MVLIKYIKPSKFDCLLFTPIDMKDAEYIKVKTHNGNEYIFLKKNRIKSPKELVSGKIYKITTKTWIHDGFGYTNYYLEPACLIKNDDEKPDENKT